MKKFSLIIVLCLIFTTGCTEEKCEISDIAKQELCAACINCNGEQHRIQEVEAQLMHVNAISQSQKSISSHDRQGSMECVI